jgi:hypothetical protein
MSEDKILEIKNNILDLVDSFSNISFKKKEFVPGFFTEA